MDFHLEPEQIDLLSAIVEEHRSVPRAQRDRFFVSNTQQGSYAWYPKASDAWQLRIVQADLEVLASCGWINPRYGDRMLVSGFSVTPNGLAAYEELKRRAGASVVQVEAEVRRYLDSEAFAARYPRAHEKWRQAEEPLWGTESQQALTTIGHHCREAMQIFASELVTTYPLPKAIPDPANTVERVRSVLTLAREKLGEVERAFLDALLAYWGTVADLSQRQEHGTLKEGKSLEWEDARRLVFQTAVVMFEIDRATRRALA